MNQREFEELLKSGANVNAQDNEDRAPLSPDEEVFELLLNHGSNLHLINQDGETLLFEAVRNEKYTVVEYLIDQGLDVNCVNFKDGSTPLHAACQSKIPSIKIIKLLMRNGAVVDAIDFEGRTPLMYITDKIYLGNLRSMADNFKLVRDLQKFLLKYSDINATASNIYNLLNYDRSGLSDKDIIRDVAKLQALNIPIHSTILKFISAIKNFNNYQQQCTNELLLMKNTKLKNSWVTYFNLLTDSKRKLKNYAANNDLLGDLVTSFIDEKFPNYGPSILHNVDKGMKKRKLFDESTLLLSDCLPIFNPTHLVIWDILDCMSTKDLSNFTSQVYETYQDE